ncbi:hypothetical protein B0H11DRAFT_1898322 [Mycena galericulata]|nr:hypothetical protein B0H11DRAFT_1898322 [Mycena galericulata]
MSAKNDIQLHTQRWAHEFMAAVHARLDAGAGARLAVAGIDVHAHVDIVRLPCTHPLGTRVKNGSGRGTESHTLLCAPPHLVPQERSRLAAHAALGARIRGYTACAADADALQIGHEAPDMIRGCGYRQTRSGGCGMHSSRSSLCTQCRDKRMRERDENLRCALHFWPVKIRDSENVVRKEDQYTHVYTNPEASCTAFPFPVLLLRPPGHNHRPPIVVARIKLQFWFIAPMVRRSERWCENYGRELLDMVSTWYSNPHGSFKGRSAGNGSVAYGVLAVVEEQEKPSPTMGVAWKKQDVTHGTPVTHH